MGKKGAGRCWAQGNNGKKCTGKIGKVFLETGEDSGKVQESTQLKINREPVLAGSIPNKKITKADMPSELFLCQRHEDELHERGILQFFKAYNVAENEWNDDEMLEDRYLTYLDPDVLEGVANARKSMEVTGGYGYVPGFGELRQANIDLENLPLTDKQLMAVCLVFYGGIKKKNAARAMKISAQALSDHIKAALKKIKGELCHS